MVGIPDALRNVEKTSAFLRFMDGDDVQMVPEKEFGAAPVGVHILETLESQRAQHGHARFRITAELGINIGKKAVAPFYGGLHVSGRFQPEHPGFLAPEFPGGMVAEQAVESRHLHPAAEQFRRGMAQKAPCV